jgi:hypothetical protein
MFCPHCGNEVGEGQLFCQHCGASLVAESPAATTTNREKNPWEERERTGFFSGLFQTVTEVLFRPSAFFHKMEVRGGYTDPILFAMIVGMIGLTASYVWQIMLKSTLQTMLPGMQASSAYPALQASDTIVLAFFIPFFLIAGLFISAGFLHLFLLMVKGAKAGFEATFRVVAYAGSANVLLLIPFCGNIVSGIWIIVLLIVGFKEAHEISGGKATAAVLFPLITCCVFFVLMLALFMGAIAASFGTVMPWTR